MRILLVDDEKSLLKLLHTSLQSPDFQMDLAETANEGLQKFASEEYDAVVTDIGLPDMDGLDLLQKFKQEHSEIPVIVITAHGSIDSALTAMKRGAYDYIQKPFEPEELKVAVERATRETQLVKDYTHLRQTVEQAYDFGSILGKSKPMLALFDRMRKAADTKSTILITGESGTGKELIAKAIHFNSPRKKKAFVVVDCGAIPGNLLESELFGHMKGAFTGADSQKKGLCEEANGGTLFLDEIGEMPIEMQTKLLRLLQESTIRRVGDTKAISLDLRIIAATNRNLENEIRDKKFRQDLFYRLNVVPLSAPALRERGDDISLLAYFFLRKFAKSYSRPAEKISDPVMHRLLTYEWPGNIRQLEHIIEQMVVMTESKTLELDSLPPPLSDAQAIDTPKVPDTEWDLKAAVEKLTRYTEEYMIRRALEKTGNNKTKASALLGLSRRALIYKAQEYRIGPESNEDPEETEVGT